MQLILDNLFLTLGFLALGVIIWVNLRRLEYERECLGVAVSDMLDRYGDRHPEIHHVSDYLESRTEELLASNGRFTPDSSRALSELGLRLRKAPDPQYHPDTPVRKH